MKALYIILASLLFVACTSPITSYEECVNAGFPIMESYPEQCSDGTNTFTREILIETFKIESQLEDCVGVGPQECMIVNGDYFYDTIEGFTFESGYEYEITVEKTERENVPADASKYTYELQQLVSKEKVIKACTRDYRPVCAEVQIQCITTPCNPIKTTFSNQCEAENAGATILYDGMCEEKINPQGACLSFDGNWIESTQECEGMGQNQCEELGGTFNECASACRNDPQAQVCTMQCVVICQFE